MADVCFPGKPTHCTTCLCEDPKSLKIRRRKVAGGIEHYCWQCLKCGNRVGGAVKKTLVLRLSEGRHPKEFDEELLSRYEAEREQLRDEQAKKYQDRLEEIRRDNEAFNQWYQSYLTTPRWREKRSAVIERCGGTCEGCGLFPVEEVHHTTYDNVGDELLYQLVGLCSFCHRKAHNPRDWREIKIWRPANGAA